MYGLPPLIRYPFFCEFRKQSSSHSANVAFLLYINILKLGFGEFVEIVIELLKVGDGITPYGRYPFFCEFRKQSSSHSANVAFLLYINILKLELGIFIYSKKAQHLWC